MSDKTALRSLQTAIDAVRADCTGPEYKDLLAAVDTADRAAEKALGEPDDSAEDKRTESQPKDLKSAAETVRKQFAARRAAK